MRLAVLPGFGNTRFDAIPQDVPFILSEHRQHPRHCLPARRREIQRIICRHTFDTKGSSATIKSENPIATGGRVAQITVSEK